MIPLKNIKEPKQKPSAIKPLAFFRPLDTLITGEQCLTSFQNKKMSVFESLETQDNIQKSVRQSQIKLFERKRLSNKYTEKTGSQRFHLKTNKYGNEMKNIHLTLRAKDPCLRSADAGAKQNWEPPTQESLK